MNYRKCLSGTVLNCAMQISVMICITWSPQADGGSISTEIYHPPQRSTSKAPPPGVPAKQTVGITGSKDKGVSYYSRGWFSSTDPEFIAAAQQVASDSQRAAEHMQQLKQQQKFLEKSNNGIPGPAPVVDPLPDQNSGTKLCPSTDKPVNIATGEKWKTEPDFSSAGWHGLSLARTYLSKSSAGLIFGVGWRSNLGNR